MSLKKGMHRWQMEDRAQETVSITLKNECCIWKHLNYTNEGQQPNCACYCHLSPLLSHTVCPKYNSWSWKVCDLRPVEFRSQGLSWSEAHIQISVLSQLHPEKMNFCMKLSLLTAKPKEPQIQHCGSIHDGHKKIPSFLSQRLRMKGHKDHYAWESLQGPWEQRIPEQIPKLPNLYTWQEMNFVRNLKCIQQICICPTLI
jgi:hypothetical protein